MRRCARYLSMVVTSMVVTALALLALAGCTPGSSAGSGSPGPTSLPPNATTVRVVDGDTIVARINGRSHPVRLIGIDTPETVDERKPVQCYGPEASKHTAALLPTGTPIRLELDAEARDRYDRLLAYVYRATDGLFVNLELAADGYAVPLVIAPNTAHSAPIAAASAAARATGLGLWGACGGPGVPLDADGSVAGRVPAPGG
jgi:micrococcal nuclease